MPSSSKAQRNFMAAIAHSPAFAKKVGVPQSVGQDFNKADKGRKFKEGGDTMATKGVNPFARFEKSGKDTEAKGKGKEGSKKEEAFDKSQMGMKRGGGVKCMAEGGMTDIAEDKAMIKKAFKEHDAQEHKGGQGTTLKLAQGGSFRASANGIAQRGKTDAMMPKMAEGGIAKRSAGAGRGFVNPQRLDESDADYVTPKQRLDMEQAVAEKKTQASTNKKYDESSYAKGGTVDGIAQRGKTRGRMC